MRIRLADFSLEYAEKGQGIPVLLIHGFPLNKEMWEPQIDDLSNSARVLAPDLRGHGHSEHTRGNYSMDLLAQDCYEFLEAKEIKEPVVVCGLSMGGYIAFAFCRKYPDRVAGLVLAATRSAPDTEEGKVRREEMVAVALEKGPEAVVESMLPKMMSPLTYERKPELVKKVKAIMNQTSRDGMAGALLGMKERLDALEVLQTFDSPALILHGADDQLIPASEAEDMQKKMKNAKLKIIPEAGHLLNLEKPEEFNQAFRDFIKLI